MESESPIYIKRERTSQLFSRGILATKLEVIGFSFQDAYEISISVYQKLLELKKETFSKRELDKLVFELLLEQYNKELANQYLVVEKWRDTSIPLWIIIAGAIGVGKSTLSRKIAGDFDIRHIIGTDLVRDVLRKTLSPEISPELHSPSYLAYKKLRPIYSARYDDVIIGFESHAKFVNIGIEAILNRAATENVSVVIEGEHLLPSFFDNEKMKLSNIVYLTLGVEDEALHLKNLSEQYSKEKEELIKHFSKIRKIHDYLIHETKLRKLTLVEIKEGTDPIFEVRKHIIRKIENLISVKKNNG
ncbi:MAG: hypothetical protein ACTSQE_08115 [Candidatus Heimdallarchaeaceae archaeon]